jgi:hypothetical protein
MEGNTHRGTTWLLLAALIGIVCLHATPAHAQQASERLVLKDGGYQSVVKYEVQGDRVHYLSSERYEWEDIPSSLIDWDATKKYNDQLASDKARIRIVETPEEKEARQKEEANSPQIAPGLNLPGSGGVFLLDELKGKPELAEIIQNGSEANKNAKKNVLRSAIEPFSGTKQGLEIKGEHAQIQSHVPRPTIYIDIDEGPINDAGLNDRFRLVRVVARKDTRIIGTAKVSVSGKVSNQASFLPANVEKMSTGQWIKLTPTQNLAPGEYAVVEMLSPTEMNLYVWDFGVNPSAPPNPNTWRPVENKQAD